MYNKSEETGILSLGNLIDQADNIEVAHYASATVLSNEDDTIISIEQLRSDRFAAYTYSCKYDYAKRRHQSLRRFDYYLDALKFAASAMGVID